MVEIVHRAKIVGFPDGNILSLCPTMDLLILSMNKTSIWVFRLNGERIYSVNNKSAVLDFAWSPDGQFFCVSAVDGSCKIYDTNNGALVKTVACGGTIDLVRWFRQDMNCASEELFAVDILDSMPKLSDFQNTQTLNYLVISASNKLQFFFNTLVKIDMALDADIVCNDNVNLFNQYFLVTNEMYALQLVRFFVSDAQLSQTRIQSLLLCFCKLKALLGNLQSYVNSFVGEASAFHRLLDRYLSNYYDNLVEGEAIEHSDNNTKQQHIVKSLIGTLLSGLVPTKLCDYWLNQFGEKGHKRLLKQGNSLYDTIRDTVFKSVIPSLERLVIVLTELASQVKWDQVQASQDYGLVPEEINALIHKTKEYLKLAYEVIWATNEEQKSFQQFMEWVKYLIVCLNKEKNDEEIKLQTTFDSVELMKYFNGHLFLSSLADYISFDASDLDLLNTTHKPRNDLAVNYIYLHDYFEDNLMAKFAHYFASIFIRSDPIDLDLMATENVCLKLHEGAGLVFTTSGSEINLVRFDESSNKVKKTLIADSTIMDFRVAHDELVLLVKQDSFYTVVSYAYDEVFRTEASKLADITPLKSTSITQLHPKHMLVNQQRQYMCLLDENKKDYIICKA